MAVPPRQCPQLGRQGRRSVLCAAHGSLSRAWTDGHTAALSPSVRAAPFRVAPFGGQLSGDNAASELPPFLLGITIDRESRCVEWSLLGRCTREPANPNPNPRPHPNPNPHQVRARASYSLTHILTHTHTHTLTLTRCAREPANPNPNPSPHPNPSPPPTPNPDQVRARASVDGGEVCHLVHDPGE